jgi:hypothetical protein
VGWSILSCKWPTWELFYCTLTDENRTDIEQEVNGLYSFDRREKIDAGRVKVIFGAAAKMYHEQILSA